MAIEFACACGARLRVPDDDAGRTVRCGKCQSALRAPVPPPPPEPIPVASDRVEALPTASVPQPVPEPEPLPLAEDIPSDEEATVPNEVLVPSEEVPTTSATPRPPRPRKHARPRREPARESEGAPVLRTLLTVGLVALVAGVGLGVLVWRSVYGPTEWREHRSAAGGYKVDLPADPRDDIEDLIGFPQENVGGVTARVEGTVHRRMEYAVIWAEFPGGRDHRATDDEIINAAIQGMGMTAHRARIDPGKPVRVNGFNGREVVATVPDEGTYVFRIVVAEIRLYVVAAGGRAGGSEHPDVRRFIDSFEVTDPHILSIARLREQAAAQARQEEERRREEERRIAEERRLAEARRLAEEKRREDERRATEERKRREAEGAAEKFRAAQPGLSAPDPTSLPGLVRYLGCDELTGEELPIWPKETGIAPRGAALGPGVRGKALYLAANPRGVTIPNDGVPANLLEHPLTVAGWAKVGGGTVELFRASTGPLAVTVSLGPERVTARLPAAAKHPDENVPGTLSATVPNDGRWHHVAFTRSGADSGSRTFLYVDGAVAAWHAFPPAKNPFTDLTAGNPVLHAERGGVFYKVAHPDLPVAAVDEVCLFDRALGPPEVRFLAGKVKSPEPPTGERYRLAPHTLIHPVAGVAFDPERKVVWAVTAVRPHWEQDRRPEWSDQRAFLVKYTYPDFKPAGAWPLPPARINGRDFTPLGGPPALDAKNNRLFVAVYNSTEDAHLQKPPEPQGTFHRFDLDSLPESPPDGPAPVLTAAARMTDRGAGQKLGGAAVSPDGKWLYFHDPAAFPPPGTFGTPVCRVPTTLAGKPEQLFVPGLPGAPRSLWLTPDGKTLRVAQYGRTVTSVGPHESGVLEIDTAEWAARLLLPVRLTSAKPASPPAPLAVHPDGRVFVAPDSVLVEFDPLPGNRRPRPAIVGARTFLRVSADGRFLFAADAETPSNRLTVLDARRNTDRPEELAALDGAGDLRVGGPFDVSPDGRFVVFRSGLVVRVDEGEAALKPLPKWVPPNLSELKDPDTVKPKDPGEAAPKPKRGAVPAATEIKGLTFYLACDELDGKSVKEAVSGKFVGTAKVIELIDGPRGKAIRVSSDPKAAVGDVTLNLTDQAAALAVGEGKPFTLAVWVRADDWAAYGGKIVWGQFISAQTMRYLALSPTETGARAYLSGGPAKTTPRVEEHREFSPAREWVHLAVSRDEKGVVRFAVDGGVRVVKAEPFPHALPFAAFGFGDRTPRPYPIEIDEFCRFDRALTDDEVRRLAGK